MTKTNPNSLEDRLEALDQKLAQQKKQDEIKEKEAQKDETSLAIGLKIASEFVSGVIVGAGIGWAIDKIAGTSPLFLIIFLMLGFAAGVMNVLRLEGNVKKN